MLLRCRSLCRQTVPNIFYIRTRYKTAYRGFCCPYLLTGLRTLFTASHDRLAVPQVGTAFLHLVLERNFSIMTRQSRFTTSNYSEVWPPTPTYWTTTVQPTIYLAPHGDLVLSGCTTIYLVAPLSIDFFRPFTLTTHTVRFKPLASVSFRTGCCTAFLEGMTAIVAGA